MVHKTNIDFQSVGCVYPPLLMGPGHYGGIGMKKIYDSLLFSFLLLQIYHLFSTISNFDVLEPIIARLSACKARQKPLLNLFCLYNYTNHTFIIIKENYSFTNQEFLS